MRYYNYKVLLTGDSGVGKTSLVYRFVHNQFKESSKRTIGVDIVIKEGLEIEDKRVKLSIWDLGGEERFRAMLQGYMKNANGILFFFDLSKINSLNNIGEWLEIIKRVSPDLPILLIGAKSDIFKRDPKDLKTISIIREHYEFFDYIETSSKLGVNVEESFDLITQEIYDKIIIH